jgi:quinol monooxygenase YgiN
MINRIVKLTIKKGEMQAFTQKLEDYHPNVRNFKGCLFLKLMVEPNDAVVFTYSGWNSPESLELYRKSDLFKAFWKDIKPHFAQKAEAWSTKEIFAEN